MRFCVISALFCLLPCFSLLAQSSNGYEITVDIEGYEEDLLTLGYYMMDNQYILDTAYRSDAGTFTFASDTTTLDPGIYLIVLSPDNNYFEMLVGSTEDQHFTIRTREDNLGDITVTGSPENRLFFDYLAYLRDRQEESLPYRELLQDSTSAPALRAEARTALSAIDQRVKTYQDSLMQAAPEAFVSAIIAVNRAPEPPEFAEVEDSEERQRLQWRWMQNHYLDGLRLDDPRLVRTPSLFRRIDYFVNNLQVRHPDTLAAAIDEVLARMDPASEAYKLFVVHYTNEAATSKIVGMDALYVHMVDRYYRDGQAYWADGEQVNKMVDNADRLKPLLIGKRAPDLQMIKRSGEPINLYDVNADFTVLYFWRYDCPACKKSTPHMKTFFETYADRGVEIFSVCTKGADEIGECWDYVDEQGTGDWVQVADPYQRFYKEYDIKSTPAIFLLDRDKTIISKRIGAEQLGEVIEDVLRQRGMNGK